MPTRKTLRRVHRKLCIGDLREVVKLQTRSMEAPIFSETDFTEKFSGTIEAWAKVVTTSGRSVFVETNTDESISHAISIRYDARVSAETWVELCDDEGTRLDIVDVENLEERNEFLILLCTERGPKSKKASEA